MELKFRPEAEEELLESHSWYEQRSPGLGFEFARTVESAISALMRNPFAYPQIENDIRHIVIRRFPFSIIYIAREDELLIISVFHHKRKPSSWRNRVNP